MYSGIFAILFLIGLLVLAILYLNTISKTLRLVRYENRMREPGDAWYMLIPLYNYFFYFSLVKDVAKSIENEYRSRDLHTDDMPTYKVGLFTAIAVVCVAVFNLLGTLFFPYSLSYEKIKGYLGLGQMALWIGHWVQIYQYKKKLQTLPQLEEEIPDI